MIGRTNAVSGGGGESLYDIKSALISDGNQYIDTGYVFNTSSGKNKFVLIAQLDSGNKILAGAMDTDTTKGFYICGSPSRGSVIGVSADDTSMTPENYYMVFSSYGRVFGAGVSSNSLGRLITTQNTPVALFALNTNGVISYKCAGIIFNARFYEDKKLVGNFEPAIRKSDNAIGMLDTINNEFHENLGTGTFTII